MRPRGIRRLFRFPTRTARDVRSDVGEEVAFHLEMRTRELQSHGLNAVDADAQARREFGDPAHCARLLERRGHDMERSRMTTRMFGELRRDAVHAIRLIERNRGFSIAAIATLAVAIGGNTTMFGVVNGLFLQPLPISAPDRLARIYTGESTVSWLNAQDVRHQNPVFSDVIVQAQSQMSMAAEPLPLRLSVGLVSPDYFRVLGTRPLMGRTFQESDRAGVVVLGERFWRTRLGADPNVIGRPLTIDGRAYEVTGVMPRAFRGIAPAGFTRDVWIPVDPGGVHRGLTGDRTAARFEAYGRLAAGVHMEEAAAAMRVVGARLAGEHPEINQRFASIEVFPASGVGLYRGVAKTLLPVFVFVGFLSMVAVVVLLISCANLAGLLLGRAAARRQEIAMRLALGASRGRLARQLLTESLVLALIGGGAGLLLAVAANAGLSSLAGRLPVAVDLSLQVDYRVLGYTLVVAIGSALLFGLAPARRASRVDLVETLKGSSGVAPARHRMRHALIVGQVAFSAILLFWSCLFVRSLMHASEVETGFEANGVLLAEIQLADDMQPSTARVDTAFVELYERIRTLPFVEAAGWSSIVPLALRGNERFRVSTPDQPQSVPGLWIVASRLGPGWFETVRIPFVAGRDFAWSDREGSAPVVIVNETLARQLWNGAALGQQLKRGTITMEVIGVVRDSKYWTLGEPIAPTVYLPFRQSLALYPPTLHVRTSNPRDTAERIRQQVQAVTPGTSLDLRAMTDAVAAAVLPARIGAMVTGAFGLLGALLATLGVYGLIGYLVVQRSRELAIRRAVGASGRHIMRVAVGRTLLLAGVGLALGLVAGAGAAPLLGGLLVNVSPLDPVTLIATSAIVLAATALASAGPARRAARIDPLAALKAE